MWIDGYRRLFLKFRKKNNPFSCVWFSFGKWCFQWPVLCKDFGFRLILLIVVVMVLVIQKELCKMQFVFKFYANEVTLWFRFLVKEENRFSSRKRRWIHKYFKEGFCPVAKDLDRYSFFVFFLIGFLIKGRKWFGNQIPDGIIWFVD